MSLISAALEMLQDPQHGGLNGVLEKLNQAGFGDQVKSWIGTGANLPISPDALQQALGSGKLQELAARVGVSPEVLKEQLAQHLPGLVDKLSPNGQLPDNAMLQQGLSMLRGKLGF